MKRKKLARAAAAETARVYGATVPEYRQPVDPHGILAQLEADAERLMDQFEADAAVVDALRKGMSSPTILDAYGISYGQLRAVRKRIMHVEGAA